MTETNNIGNSNGQDNKPLDYIIVGAGPAGLQLGYFLDRAGRDYLILEAERPAHFFAHFPRHRRLISNNKVHTGFTDRDKNLRWDWNSLLSDGLEHLFTDYTEDYFPKADTLVQYLRDYQRRFDLRMEHDTRVTRISRPDGASEFRLEAEDGRVWWSRRVIVATGHTVTHTPDIPGAELCEQYAGIPTDPDAFTNQRVLIIGKGNSGMETAENIFHKTASTHMLSPSPVRLAWTSHHVSDVRGCYHNTMDSYQLKMQNTILDASLLGFEKLPDGRIRATFRYSHGMEQVADLTVDRVIMCCGFRFDYSIFDDTCRPDHGREPRWPAMTTSWESPNVPGLYFIGTLMQARDYKRSFSGFIHGFRYNIRFLDRVFAQRYHGEPLRAKSLPRTAEDIAVHLVERANHASSMFQLPAFLGDMYLLDEENGDVACYEDVPKDYALDAPEWANRKKLITTLEYGKLPTGADPFAIPRDPTDGSTSVFVHPVTRLYDGDRLVDSYHVPEDLENEWDEPVYTGPLQEAIGRMLSRATAPAGAAG